MGEMRARLSSVVKECDIHGLDWNQTAYEVLRAMQIPSNRAVAHAADKLQMDPTKVAAVWMCIIEG